MEREEGAPLLGVEGATASRGEGATASSRDDGATSREAGEGAISSKGTKAATKKTSLLGKLLARFGAASLDSQSEHVQVKKLSHISLQPMDVGYLTFGQDSFIIGLEKDQTFHFYKFSGRKYEPLWTKPIPEGFVFNDYTQVSENLDIYTLRTDKEVWRYNKDLKLIDKLPSPGNMIGLLHGGQDALMDNWGQIAEEEDVMVSVAPLTNLLDAHHYLDIPRDGAYKGKDTLIACGRQDGRVVVVSLREPFVDFYSERGRHIRRAQLPHDAGRPGCSDTHVLVPLWEKPQICVFNWSGDLLHTLGREQLGLFTVDRGVSVSPVRNGIFSFWIYTDEYQVHTYESEGATSRGGDEGAASRGGDDRATSSRGTKAATEKASPERSLLARFGAASLESPSEHVQVRKLSHISLPPSTGLSYLTFGQDSFIIGFEKDQTYNFYKFSGLKYELLWTKPIPEGLLYNAFKQVSENLDIYINRTEEEVWRYNEDLKLIDKLPSPGSMIGLLHGGQDALMDNWGQITEEEEDMMVSVAPLTDLLNAHHYLDIPRDGAYKRKDEVLACGRQDGRVVVVAYREPFVDFYSERGRHICRGQLPHGAGIPGCSDTHVLVPLLEKPQICIFNWSGDQLHTLGREQLGVYTVDRGYAVSPVRNGIFSFWICTDEHQVHTYELL